MKCPRWIAVVLSLAPIVVLAWCSAGLPDSLRSPSSVEELREGITAHCAGQPEDDDCREDTEAAYCRHKGGRWMQFYNGCRDTCIPPSANRICTMDTPMGCECGRRLCWNGLECMANPGPRPEIELDLPTMDNACTTCERPDGVCTAESLTAMGQCVDAWFAAAATKVDPLSAEEVGAIAEVCLDDKRTQINVTLRSLGERRAEFDALGQPAPESAPDAGVDASERADHLRRLTTILLERLSRLETEAQGCAHAGAGL